MKKKRDTDKYPGYPSYPPREDITQPGNNNGKQPIEAEPPLPPFNDTIDEQDDAAIVQGTEADVTAADLNMLQAAEQNMDTPDGRNLVRSALDNTDEDGEPLNESGSLTDIAGTELDIPGGEEDDANELIGEEDEENNYYSLGGDLHENQEENKGE